MRSAKFRELMGSALTQAIEADTESAFGVWAEGTLVYVNSAWSRMARENQGESVLEQWPLGRSVWDAIPDVLQAHYRDLWQRALQSKRACEHEYECSSPERQRLFRMMIHPVGDHGLVIRNHLVIELPHPGPAAAPVRETYAADSGFTTICANCRRVRNAMDHALWDWVPEFVANPPAEISHGLCRTCLELYYPATR